MEFTLLGLLLAFGFYHYLSGRVFLTFYLTFMTGFFIGLTDEIHQLFVRGRQCDWTDLIADTVGVLTGWLLFKLISQRRQKAVKTVSTS